MIVQIIIGLLRGREIRFGFSANCLILLSVEERDMSSVMHEMGKSGCAGFISGAFIGNKWQFLDPSLDLIHFLTLLSFSRLPECRFPGIEANSAES
jgi:hypothetical protein